MTHPPNPEPVPTEAERLCDNDAESLRNAQCRDDEISVHLEMHAAGRCPQASDESLAAFTEAVLARRGQPSDHPVESVEGERWTVKNGRSNSSDEFIALAHRIGRLLRDSAHGLIGGDTNGVGRLIAAQLAHADPKFVPLSSLQRIEAQVQAFLDVWDEFDGPPLTPQDTFNAVAESVEGLRNLLPKSKATG